MRKLNEFLGISFLIYLIIHGVPHCRSDCKHVYVDTGNYLDYLVSENMVLADDPLPCSLHISLWTKDVFMFDSA